MLDLTTTSALDVARRVSARQLSAVEVSRAARSKSRGSTILCAPSSPSPETRPLKRPRRGKNLLDGRRLLAVKDSFHTAGVRTTAGSRAFADFVSECDAESVARLKTAGCVLVGKSPMYEFAYGFTSRNAHLGDCKNPWDRTRIPGGSSGGNAAALATGTALAALGGDTGGSIRISAARCGIVGLKVTYGRVSRHGGIPLSWSMDTVGPMTRTVADAAALFEVLAGHDPKDRPSAACPRPKDLILSSPTPKGSASASPISTFSKPRRPTSPTQSMRRSRSRNKAGRPSSMPLSPRSTPCAERTAPLSSAKHRPRMSP